MFKITTLFFHSNEKILFYFYLVQNNYKLQMIYSNAEFIAT